MLDRVDTGLDSFSSPFAELVEWLLGGGGWRVEGRGSEEEKRTVNLTCQWTRTRPMCMFSLVTCGPGIFSHRQ